MIGHGMKLLLICYVIAVVCISIIQSKRSYTAVVEKLEILNEDKNYFQNVQIKATKFNRTVSVLNGTFEVINDLPLSLWVDINTYQKYGPEYKKSVVEWHNVTLCNFIETDQLLYPDLVKASNLPPKCPLLKKLFYLSNFVVNEEQLPEYLPGGNWRIDVRIKNDDKLIAMFKFYLKIVHSMMKTNLMRG